MTNENFYFDNVRWLSAGALLTFSTAFGQTFFISIFAGAIRNEFAISHGSWGAIYAVGTLSSALLMFVAGSLPDKYTAKSVTFIIMVFFALSCFSMALCSAVWMLPLIIFGLRFCGQGMLGHLAMVFAGRWFQKNRGKTIAITSLGLSASEACLPFLFVIIMGFLGWRWSWAIAAISIIILVIPITILLAKERNPEKSGDGNKQHLTGMLGMHWTRQQVLKNWVFWLALPALMVQPIFSTTFFFQQVYFTEIKGWDLSDFVSLLPIYTFTSLSGLFLGGLIIDRFKVSLLLPLYLIPMAVGFIIASKAETLISAGLCFAFLGLMQGLGATVSGTFWPEYFGTKHLGAVRSIATSLMVFASALGPISSGYMIDFGIGLEKQYIVMGLLTFFACAGMFFISVYAPKN